MMKQPTFYSTWLPLGLAVVALAVLNWGLYTRLESQQIKPLYTFPYYEDFSTTTAVTYEQFGGDWEIRDQTLVQLSTSGYDLISFIPLTLDAKQSYAFEASMKYLGGDMGSGMMFNAQQMTSRQKSHMVRFNRDGDALWVIYGYFADDSNFVGQGSVPTTLAVNDANPHIMRVRVEGDKYAVYLDGVQLASDIPTVYNGGSVGFITATSQVAFDNISLDVPKDTVVAMTPPPAETPLPDASTPVPVTTSPDTQTTLTESFDNPAGTESLWKPISGTWAFADGQYVQSQTDAFDLSTIYQSPVTYPMTYTARFNHRTGVGGGLLFNIPLGDNKNGAYMARYFEDGSVVAWGYFDATGVFVGQGSTTVALPAQTAHALSVTTDGTVFSLALDGTELVANVPLTNPVSPSYVGLTASQSNVGFEDVTILTAAQNTLNTSNTAGAQIDSAAAIGTWQVDGAIITQTDIELTDYIAGTGLAGEQFSISADLAWKADNPDVGAGIMFHMNGRDDPSLGYIVRFGSGGKELFWGQYDANRVFTGLGGVPIEIVTGESVNLLLVVRNGTFDINVNGKPLVQAIPIERAQGWIGLVSFSGPVTFSNVNIVLGN